MTQESLIVIGILLFGFIFLAALLYRLTSKLKESNTSTDIEKVIKLIQQVGSEDRRILLQSLQSNSNSLNIRLDKAAEVISSVQKNIGELSEIGRGMKEVQQFLKSPKIRGAMGEHILKDLLAQLLPRQSFILQFRFRSGSIVDAVIKTAHGLIPIDSKFPLENFLSFTKAETDQEKNNARKLFLSDVKKHIIAISTKYIRIDEKTTDYALMYIPSESIYYEIVNDTQLYDYAVSQRVLPVSPTTFYAFLNAILMSFEGQKIEEQAQQILQSFRSLSSDFEHINQQLSVTSKHLTNAHNSMQGILSLSSTFHHKFRSSIKLSLPESST